MWIGWIGWIGWIESDALLGDVLDAVGLFVSGRPKIEILTARRKLANSDD